MKNAKLWKRVLHENLHGPDPYPTITNEIVKAPIIMDSRPGDTYTTDLGKRGLAMPFRLFWYEYEIPQQQVLAGVLVVNDSVVNVTPDMVRETPELCAPDVRHVRCITVCATPKHPPTAIADVTFGLDRQGDVVGSFDDRTMVYGVTWILPTADPDAIMTPVANLLDTLELMSCKNVGLASRPAHPRDAKIASKRHGPKADGYRYHVLVVRPAGARSDAPAQEIGTMPRHICRGHFAEYGPKYGKGKLFGKLEGRFYIPPHVKGKAENGVVEKDYEVREIGVEAHHAE